MADINEVVVRGSAAGFAQEILAGRHPLRADEPVAAGGADTDRVDPGEDRRVGANAQSQREHHREGEAWSAPEQPYAVSQVLPKGFHRLCRLTTRFHLKLCHDKSSSFHTFSSAEAIRYAGSF